MEWRESDAGEEEEIGGGEGTKGKVEADEEDTLSTKRTRAKGCSGGDGEE